MEKFSFVILIVSCIAATVDAVIVNCKFGSNTWNHVTGSFYRCLVQNQDVFTASLVSIDYVMGTHTRDKDNYGVTEFDLDLAPNLVHFPKNLEKLFPDLEAIGIQRTKLQAITQDDLKVFPRLRAVYFYDNHLKIITADTFRLNPRLEQISLDDNQIFHVEPYTFDGLRRLSSLDLRGNAHNCDVTVARTKSDTAKLVEKINKRKCYSLAYVVQQKLEGFMENEQKQNEKLEKQMEQVLTQIQILARKVENNHQQPAN
jgi:hypothetical protein